MSVWLGASIHPLCMAVCPLYICIPLIWPYTPICPYAPCTLCPPIHQYVPHTFWGLWRASKQSICHGGFGGHHTLVHLSQICVSVSTPIYPSVHKSYQLLSISVSHFSTGCLWMYAQLHAIDFFFSLNCFHSVSSFCYHSYDHYSSCGCCVLWYVISPHNCYHGPLIDGASSDTRSAWCGSATTADTTELSRCYWPCHCAAAVTSISDTS